VTDGLFKLQSAGMTPIITHPERNAILQRRPERVLEWVDGAGCLVQVTASAVTGFWGPIAKRVAMWLLDHDAVHVLATDAHDDKNRPPILSQARDVVSQRFGGELARALVLDNPAAIVAGQSLPSSRTLNTRPRRKTTPEKRLRPPFRSARQGAADSMDFLFPAGHTW
jgi:protein-tyrosine phosphatase